MGDTCNARHLLTDTGMDQTEVIKRIDQTGKIILGHATILQTPTPGEVGVMSAGVIRRQQLAGDVALGFRQ